MTSSTPQLLTETYKFQYHLEESTGGLLRATGRFGRCDVPTANGRVYPRYLMAREFKRLMPLMRNRGLYGELDHPGDGKTSLKRVSHIITDLKIEDDNTVSGSWEVIPGTTHGKQLQALAEANVQFGVSSRGLGSVVRDRNGNSVVQEDFKLLTYDVVADPAVGDAVPEVFYEGYIPTGVPLSEVAFNPNAEAALAQRLKEEGVDNIDALIQKVRQDAIAESRRQQPYEVQGSRAQVRHEADRADEVERSRVESYNRGMADGVDRFMSNDFVGRDIATMQTIREHVVSTTDIESELLEQSNRIQQAQDEQIAMLESEVHRREDLIARLSFQLREQFETNLIAHHIARVPNKHRKHFVEMVGPTSEFSSIELLEHHVRVVAKEFIATGRYFNNDIDSVISVHEDLEESYAAIDDLQDTINFLEGKLESNSGSIAKARAEFEKLSEQIESQAQEAEITRRALSEERDRSRRFHQQLQKAVASLAEAKSIIKGSEGAKVELDEEIQRWKDKAVELRGHLDKHIDMVRKGRAEIRGLEEQVDGMVRSSRDVSQQLEESRLDTYKYQKAFGSQDPNGIFGLLSEARSKKQVDRLVMKLNESRTPMSVHPSFRGGSQIHDHVLSESAARSMQQRLDHQREMAQVSPGSRPDLLAENNVNPVESSNGQHLNWPTQEVTESKMPSTPPAPGLPGLDPAAMLSKIKTHVPG